jgi:hypothetical protein
MKSGLMMMLLLAAAAFGEERTIVPAARGANRLDPDVALLAHARPDLGDLRLVDGHGTEVPYLIIEPPSRQARWQNGRVLPVAATKKTSGFELDLGAVHGIDRIRFEGIAAPFLKRARLEGSGDRMRWTLLAADATVFDLPDEKLKNLEIAFAPGDYRYLRVTWDDRASAVVTGIAEVSARLHGADTPPDAPRVPLGFRKIASEPQKSRYRIALPGPSLPIEAIEAVVANGEVFRTAAVFAQHFESGRIAPLPLGSSTLKRAERYGGVAADLAVRVQRPQDVDLELVVDDGNNPPLALTGIDARLAPLPWIWFESADGAPLTARYGDARKRAPSYDVEASRKSIAASAPLRAAWSSSERPSAPDNAEAATLASFRGAGVRREDYRFARGLAHAPAGVARLALDADVLARSRGLADIRLVDGENRQVPYIVENSAAPLAVPLKVPQRTADGSSSRYDVELPYETLPAGTRLIITTSAKVFERQVTLRAAADDRRAREAYALETLTWTSTQPDLAPPPLEFDVTPAQTRHLELLISEGDNAPLPIASLRLQMPAAALRFYNAGSALTLLYGNARAEAPQYDLALLAPHILGEPARELSLAAAAAEAPETTPGGTKIFWVALAAATIGLLIVLARLIASRADAAQP